MLRRLLLAAALTFGAAAAPAAEPDRIDRLFADYMRRENIPGAVLVALRGDDAALVRAWGVSDVADGTAMTAAHVQPIYSVSKQFTAALVLQLAGESRRRRFAGCA